jgi:hypothetical protein
MHGWAYDRYAMSETLWAVIVGGLLTGGVALGVQVLAARFQANAARGAYREQDRVWNRSQRLEAHHAFLDRVTRLIFAAESVAHPNPGADAGALQTNFREALARASDAYNRIDLLSPPETRELAAKVLTAARPEGIFKAEEFEGVVRAIGEASRIYRDAARAELTA